MKKHTTGTKALLEEHPDINILDGLKDTVP